MSKSSYLDSNKSKLNEIRKEKELLLKEIEKQKRLKEIRKKTNVIEPKLPKHASPPVREPSPKVVKRLKPVVAKSFSEILREAQEREKIKSVSTIQNTDLKRKCDDKNDYNLHIKKAKLSKQTEIDVSKPYANNIKFKRPTIQDSDIKSVKNDYDNSPKAKMSINDFNIKKSLKENISSRPTSKSSNNSEINKISYSDNNKSYNKSNEKQIQSSKFSQNAPKNSTIQREPTNQSREILFQSSNSKSTNNLQKLSSSKSRGILAQSSVPRSINSISKSQYSGNREVLTQSHSKHPKEFERPKNISKSVPETSTTIKNSVRTDISEIQKGTKSKVQNIQSNENVSKQSSTEFSFQKDKTKSHSRVIASQNQRGIAAQNGRGITTQNGRGIAAQNSTGIAAQNSRGIAAQNGRGITTQNGRGIAAQNSTGIAAQSRGILAQSGRNDLGDTNDSENSDYDSEMDDFIDNTEVEVSSKLRKQIHKALHYDENKYTQVSRYDNCRNMVASNGDIIKEESRSARLARMEDAEELKVEEERLKRKQKRFNE